MAKRLTPSPEPRNPADLFNETHASLTVCPITSDCIDAPLFRVSVPPGTRTGLRASSQVMVDKVLSVQRSSIAKGIGQCDGDEFAAVGQALRRWLALE